jgi:hypothetical protein
MTELLIGIHALLLERNFVLSNHEKSIQIYYHPKFGTITMWNSVDEFWSHMSNANTFIRSWYGHKSLFKYIEGLK